MKSPRRREPDQSAYENLLKAFKYYSQKVRTLEENTQNTAVQDAEQRFLQLNDEFQAAGGNAVLEKQTGLGLADHLREKQQILERTTKRTEAGVRLKHRKVKELEKEWAELKAQEDYLEAQLASKQQQLDQFSTLDHSSFFPESPAKLHFRRTSKVDSRTPRFLADIKEFSKTTLPSLTQRRMA